MEKQIKGITCCGDCVYYNWKKHKCSRGASIETDARKSFYDDCPIPDIDFQEIRNKAIDEAIEKFLQYGCVCVEWNKGLSKEELVDDVLRQAIGQVVIILEQLKGVQE